MLFDKLIFRCLAPTLILIMVYYIKILDELKISYINAITKNIFIFINIFQITSICKKIFKRRIYNNSITNM